MTAARGTVVGVVIPKKSQTPFVTLLPVIVVRAVLAFVSSVPVTMAQTAQRHRPPTLPVTTVPEDATVTQLRERANAGEATAQFSLGLMYADGHGVSQDYTQAVQWYRKAAEQGNAGGQSNLGMLYANGHGVPQDDAQAAQWYRRAAEQGFVSAQFNLGVMYFNGQGVPQDYVEAHKWENLAAARASSADQKRIAEGRDTVANKMTPAQVAEAQKLAREWTEAFERKK
jgi:TPR repeat protein